MDTNLSAGQGLSKEWLPLLHSPAAAPRGSYRCPTRRLPGVWRALHARLTSRSSTMTPISGDLSGLQFNRSVLRPHRIEEIGIIDCQNPCSLLGLCLPLLGNDRGLEYHFSAHPHRRIPDDIGFTCVF